MGNLFEAKGVVTLFRTNTLTGKVEEVVTKENVFTTYGIRRVMQLTNILPAFSNPNSLMISQQTTTPSKGNEVVTQIIGDADSNATIPNPVIWQDVTSNLPMYGEVRRRLDLQGVARTFRTILIGDRNVFSFTEYPNRATFSGWNSNTSARAGSVGKTSVPAYCYLLLDNPVTQGAFDVIDIFYRVYFIPANGNGIPKGQSLVRNIGRRLFGIASTQPGTSKEVFTSISSFTNPEDYNYVSFCGTDEGVVNQYGNANLLTGTSYNYNEASTNFFTNTTSLDMITGRLVRSCSLGELEGSTVAITARDFINPGRSPLQTSWAKRVNGNPFFDANEVSIGLGRITSSIPVQWENKYPEMYKIIITNSGNIGTSTYRLERQRFVGFARNRWIPVPVPIHHMGGVNYVSGYTYHKGSFLPDSYGTDQKLRIELLGDSDIIFWNSRGITIVNILDSKLFRSLGADTTVINPLDKLNTTDIRQIVVKGNNIYIACAATGIWKIDSSKNLGDTGYITNPYVGQAFGITLVSYQGVEDVYSVISTGITYESSGWSTIFTPTSPRITTYGYSSIATISGNTNHVDGQICILSKTSGDSRILWWSRAIGNGTMVEGILTNSSSNIWLDGTPNSIQCAETANYWALALSSSSTTVATVRPYARTTFNSTSLVYVGALTDTKLRYNELIIPARRGNYFLCYNPGRYNVGSLIDYNGEVLGFNEISASRTSGSPLDDFYNGVASVYPKERVGGFKLHQEITIVNVCRGFRILNLGRGLFFYNGYLVTPFMSTEWEQYGWDGTNWVLGSTASKPTHVAQEPLLAGINIGFNDRGQPNPYFATDFYTLPVGYGVLGDNAKTITQSLEVIASDFRYQFPYPTGTNTLIVPNINPYRVVVPGAAEGGFNGLEVSDESTFKIILDGVEVPFNQVLVDGSTPPSPRFVSINTITGALTFHPDDIGKSISGYYSYYLGL